MRLQRQLVQAVRVNPIRPLSRTVVPRPILRGIAVRPRPRFFTTTSRCQQANDAEKVLSNMDRLRLTFRKHGWTALVVYLVLSAVDFGLCFLVIYSVGADRVREAEDWVLERLHWKRKDEREKAQAARAERQKQQEQDRIEPSTTETKSRSSSQYSTLATTAAVAYAIHKTLLLPFRIGITVAVTPRVVRTLQSWGWHVGQGGKPIQSVALIGGAAQCSPSEQRK